jgi:hypothetical protein
MKVNPQTARTRQKHLLLIEEYFLKDANIQSGHEHFPPLRPKQLNV